MSSQCCKGWRHLGAVGAHITQIQNNLSNSIKHCQIPTLRVMPGSTKKPTGNADGRRPSQGLVMESA